MPASKRMNPKADGEPAAASSPPAEAADATEHTAPPKVTELPKATEPAKATEAPPEKPPAKRPGRKPTQPHKPAGAAARAPRKKAAVTSGVKEATHGTTTAQASGGGKPPAKSPAKPKAAPEQKISPAKAPGRPRAAASNKATSVTAATAAAKAPTPAKKPTPGKASSPEKTPPPAGEKPAVHTQRAPLPRTKPVEDFDALAARMMALQQEIRALGIPVVILFEGWAAAGKGTMMGELLEGLDPRGYRVHVVENPTGEEKHFPPTRRYWINMPSEGHISLFVDSWYRAVSSNLLQEKVSRDELEARYQQITQMESQLVCNGTLVLKFFLNISQKEQKKRLKTMESKKSTRWRVAKADWAQNERYDELMHLYDAMIARTHVSGALWHVLRSEKKRACKKQMYDIVIDAFELAIAQRRANLRPWDVRALPHVRPIPTAEPLSLNMFDPDQALDCDYKEALDEAQKKLRKLHNELYRKGVPLVLGFEGWDAAGKGGSILRLTRALNARYFQVVPTAAPTPDEKSHHHLWRFWNTQLEDGHITIFDRTWYGRVMVERIEGFCTQAQWQRAYEEINQFEWELHRHGAVIRKFWLQISKDEQLRRFQDRENNPEKQWKITEEDWRNREKWPAYEVAVNEMLARTHVNYAPWIVVEANNEHFARLKVLHEVIAALEGAL